MKVNLNETYIIDCTFCFGKLANECSECKLGFFLSDYECLDKCNLAYYGDIGTGKC